MGYDIDINGHLTDPSGKLCKFQIGSRGYYQYGLRVPIRVSKRRNPNGIGLHRYQALKKYGLDIFRKGIVVRHLNNNKLDNSWDNIAIGTMRDNHFDNPEDENIARTLVFYAMCNENRRKRNLDIWTKIYKDRFSGMSYGKLSDKYKMPKSSMSFHFGNGKSKVDKEYRNMILDNM